MNFVTTLVDGLASRLLVILPFVVLGLAIEAFTAARRLPAASYRTSVAFNTTCTVIFWTFDVLVGAAWMTYVSQRAERLPGAHLFAMPIGQHPGVIQVLFVAFALVAIRDFFYYWFHRLQHRSSWLWAEHQLHHSDEHMNVMTAWRHHWLEFPLEAVFVVAPFAFFVQPPAGIALVVMIVTNTMAHFIHLNSRVNLGSWSWVIANPQNHRIHHSTAPEHVDKNFAAIFPLWDVLFGTYWAPRANEYPSTGLTSGVRVQSLTQILTWPFVEWWRMSRKPSTES